MTCGSLASLPRRDRALTRLVSGERSSGQHAQPWTAVVGRATVIVVSDTLVPIVNKRMLPTFRRSTGGGPVRSECWSAETADGVWLFARIEDRGTPWSIVHKRSGETVALASSLRRCRVLVGTGQIAEPVAA